MDVEKENSANSATGLSPAHRRSAMSKLNWRQFKPVGWRLVKRNVAGRQREELSGQATSGGSKGTLFFEPVVTGPGKPATERQIAA